MVDAAWLAHLIDKVHPSTDGVTWNSYKENNAEKVTKIIYSCLRMVVDRKVITLSH